MKFQKKKARQKETWKKKAMKWVSAIHCKVSVSTYVDSVLSVLKPYVFKLIKQQRRYKWCHTASHEFL